MPITVPDVTQEMKHHHLKAYGLAMIGVFNVYAPFLSGKFVEMVVALPTIGGITDSKKTGLAVTMSPPLEFTADGLLRNPQSAVVDYYDMKKNHKIRCASYQRQQSMLWKDKAERL